MLWVYGLESTEWGYGLVAVSVSEHDNEISDFMKAGNFLTSW